ncbi:MAG: hypothetical protein WBB43_26950 [Limnoraphis sp.]
MNTLASNPTGFKPPFNYGDICESLQNEAESLVDSIRISLRKFNREALELARRINQLREQISAKQFRDWLAHYFPDAETTIRKWLKIVELAERVPEQIELMMGWATGAIVALSRASDELVKIILSGSQKLTIKQINDLIAQEREEQQSSTPASTPKPPVQLNDITIQLAKLTAHQVNLKTQLSEAVTPQAQEQLTVDINQTEQRIKQLCQDFDPKSVIITQLQSSSKPQTVNIDSENLENRENRENPNNLENSELQLQKLQSQLKTEQQSNLKLQDQIQQLKQRLTQLTPQDNNSNHPNKLEQLQTQLETERQNNAQLQEQIQQLQEQLTPSSPQKTESTESNQIDKLQHQLKERDKYIAYLHQQDSENNNNNTVFKPVFIPTQLKELELNDRIRVISPEKDGKITIIDDLVVGFDRDKHPKTKWSGTLSEQDEALGYRFERMIGTERAQSQLTQLKHQNRQLQQRIAELENPEKNNIPKKEEYQLELELRSVQNQLQKKEESFEKIMQWKDSLQRHIQKQLCPGVEVEILLDPKRVVTGMRGIVDHEFESRPGEWWVKFIHPKTQESFNRIFPAYQLYIVNYEV